VAMQDSRPIRLPIANRHATVIVNVDRVRGMEASPPQVGVWWGIHSFLSLIREERGEKTCGSLERMVAYATNSSVHPTW